jgi:hypothetical protein
MSSLPADERHPVINKKKSPVLDELETRHGMSRAQDATMVTFMYLSQPLLAYQGLGKLPAPNRGLAAHHLAGHVWGQMCSPRSCQMSM